MAVPLKLFSPLWHAVRLPPRRKYYWFRHLELRDMTKNAFLRKMIKSSLTNISYWMFSKQSGILCIGCCILSSVCRFHFMWCVVRLWNRCCVHKLWASVPRFHHFTMTSSKTLSKTFSTHAHICCYTLWKTFHIHTDLDRTNCILFYPITSKPNHHRHILRFLHYH